MRQKIAWILLGLSLAIASLVGLYGLGPTNKESLLRRDPGTPPPFWYQYHEYVGVDIQCKDVNQIGCDKNLVAIYSNPDVMFTEVGDDGISRDYVDLDAMRAENPILATVTPNPNLPWPAWYEVGGESYWNLSCDNPEIECDYGLARVYENGYLLPANPQIEFDGYYEGLHYIAETPGTPLVSSLVTITVHPTVTAQPSATFTVPSPTPAPNYEIVEWDVDVKVYYRGLGSDGKPKDLNQRKSRTLYDYSIGYSLPYCDYMPDQPPDLTECSQYPVHLLYVIHITNGLPYDKGNYFGAINGSTMLTLYTAKTDTWYTDWRP